MEKLFGIDKVLVFIYENLSFKDQLQLAQVNSSLQRIFESFIVPVKYCRLKINQEFKEGLVLVSNDNEEDCMQLTEDEADSFLKYGVAEVEKLHIVQRLTLCVVFNLTSICCITSWRNLQNLTCLHCKEIVFGDKDLLLIAEYFPKLNELVMIDCMNEENNGYLMVGDGLSVSTLEQMKNLKHLEFNYEVWTIDMSLFCDLIKRVPLECLKLGGCLVQYIPGDNVDEKTFHHHLKELKIRLDHGSLKFFERLGIFKKLLKLHLQFSDDLTDSALQIIANECENLESLCFGNETKFQITTDFIIPPILKELTFYKCINVSYKHIEDLLTKFKIEKFCCRLWGKHEYSGQIFKDFRMSPYIKKLDLYGINILEFPSFYTNNNTLKELHWREMDQNVQSLDQSRECLKTCTNLENLIVYCGFIPFDVILELKHLQKLEIHEKINEWHYIIGLLSHPSLKELHIVWSFDSYDRYCMDVSPVDGFITSITSIKISVDLFEMSLEFWLSMLQRNPKLSIKCQLGRELSFVELLIHHKNFPKDLREITIWGFNLNCKVLRENFSATIEPLRHYRYRNCYLDLRRQQNEM